MPEYFIRPLNLQTRTDNSLAVSKLFTNALLLTVLFLATVTFPAVSFAQATICGYVFLDTNQNGVKDSGELTRANHSLYLDNTMNGGVDFVVTDENGHYCFTANSVGGYLLRTDIPENTNFLTTPMRADLKAGAMPPHFVQVTNLNQEVSVDFGFVGDIGDVPIFCHLNGSAEKDNSVCVRNSEYVMQITPNNNATEVTEMDVHYENNVYIGDNNTSKVVVVERDSNTRRQTRDGNGTEDFVIEVGKNVSDDGEEFSLNAKINANGSVSFTAPDMPNFVATSTPDGFIFTDSDDSTVFELKNNGDVTVTDSEYPTMGLSVDGVSGQVAISDSEYPDTLAVINSDGSFDITDAEFPDLVATVHANNEYVVKDIVNDIVVQIDSQGSYTIIDNANQMCIELPRTRGWLSKFWKKLKKLLARITRLIQKIAGYISKISRFVAKVAPKISKFFSKVAAFSKMAAIMFPAACKFFCAVAAFSESVARISGQVGKFAEQVANIADAVHAGSTLVGSWIDNKNSNKCGVRRGTRRGVRDSNGGEISTTGIDVLSGQQIASQLSCGRL